MRHPSRLPIALLAPVLLSGCFGYRLVRPNEVEIPSYDPRPVPVPSDCELLIQRAANGAVGTFDESQARMLGFCQNQQLIRAQEEEAAARKLEAHAEVANFALRATVVAVGAVVAVLSWAF